MTDAMASQHIDLSSWDVLYVSVENVFPVVVDMCKNRHMSYNDRVRE
jgi:hypothetical protein